MDRYTELKNKLLKKEVNKALNTANIKYLNELIDSELRYQYNGGIAVERTRQRIRTVLRIKLYKFEISESRYMQLCSLNEILAQNNYR